MIVLFAAISASTEPLLSDSRRHSSDGIQTSNPRLVAVEDELKAVRVEALTPAKTQPSSGTPELPGAASLHGERGRAHRRHQPKQPPLPAPPPPPPSPPSPLPSPWWLSCYPEYLRNLSSALVADCQGRFSSSYCGRAAQEERKHTGMPPLCTLREPEAELSLSNSPSRPYDVVQSLGYLAPGNMRWLRDRTWVCPEDPNAWQERFYALGDLDGHDDDDARFLPVAHHREFKIAHPYHRGTWYYLTPGCSDLFVRYQRSRTLVTAHRATAALELVKMSMGREATTDMAHSLMLTELNATALGQNALVGFRKWLDYFDNHYEHANNLSHAGRSRDAIPPTSLRMLSMATQFQPCMRHYSLDPLDRLLADFLGAFPFGSVIERYSDMLNITTIVYLQATPFHGHHHVTFKSEVWRKTHLLREEFYDRQRTGCKPVPFQDPLGLERGDGHAGQHERAVGDIKSVLCARTPLSACAGSGHKSEQECNRLALGENELSHTLIRAGRPWFECIA